MTLLVLNETYLYFFIKNNYTIKNLFNRYLTNRKCEKIIYYYIKKQINVGIINNDKTYSKIINTYLFYKNNIPYLKYHINWINNINLRSGFYNVKYLKYMIYIHNDFVNSVIFYLSIANYNSRIKKLHLFNLICNKYYNTKNINISNYLILYIFSFI